VIRPPGVIRPPDAAAHAAARAHLASLAKPTGALGRIEDLAAWLCAVQGDCPPRPLDRVRAVVLAGDHGVARAGVSAYPPEVTAAMVDTMGAGRAAISVLARQHGVALRVVDVAVDREAEPTTAPYRVRRSSGAIHVEDALTADEVSRSLAYGRQIAEEEIAAGADLLIVGDMGIGNTAVATALIAATFGVPAHEITGRGTGVDGRTLAHKADVVQQALDRTGDRASDPFQRLAALGGADFAAGVGFLTAAAQAGVPVLLDGLATLAEAAVAEDLAPGVIAWCAAGHRSTEPAQRLALDKLGLVPLLDLDLRLGEGSGALLAVPLLRSAVALLREMALLSDLSR
jgi:nicotinate-nucleotide--dimethylbenzimidazole phosphoribosyltransferase